MSRLGPFEENTIVVGDCLDIMAQMPSGCVDLVVTSPPYNLGITKGQNWTRPVDFIIHKDNMPEAEYQGWQKKCVAEMLRLIKQKGSIIYNYKPRQRDGFVILPHKWLLGFPIHQEIIWDRRSTHNHNPTFLDPIDERLFWLSKGKPTIYQGMDNWSILRFPWAINTEFPAPFPPHLPRFFIQSLSKKDDLIFDPFIGSGTTAVVADRLGRKFFGCDINPDYVEMALERLEKDRAGRQLELL